MLISFVLFTSCATIVGGSKYNAYVKVKDHPDATIEYKGINKGKGNTFFKVKRSEANKFAITVKENGCEDETFTFSKRTFRVWAFIGTVVFWTGLYEGVPLPWGIIVDGITGAIWKPNIYEKGVSKVDYKNYIYTIDSYKCINKVDNK